MERREQVEEETFEEWKNKDELKSSQPNQEKNDQDPSIIYVYYTPSSRGKTHLEHRLLSLFNRSKINSIQIKKKMTLPFLFGREMLSKYLYI